MKKMCIGLFGMLACATMINADGFSESDRELIGAKDFPFPPGDSQEGAIPEADESEAPATSDERDDSDDDDSSSHPSQGSGKPEKKYTPEVQDE
jgi:hypothetical protein